MPSQAFMSSKKTNKTLDCVLLKDSIRAFVGTAVTQWLRCYDTNRKLAGSIPDGVIGIFH